MTVKKFGLILISFGLFLVLLVGEYLYCSVNFRFIRTWDLWATNLICGILSLLLCYWFFRDLIKEALKEKIPLIIVLVFFGTFSFLLGCFFRLNLQIANGYLDNSYPETKIVIVAGKETSVFGGSIKDGLNPMAYYIHFSDGGDKDKNCELLVPFFTYYSVGPGTNLKVSVRQGFFHLLWVEDYGIVDQ
jgi:ABC-type transport system involved in multi-copper enzyme maturation permease subunit